MAETGVTLLHVSRELSLSAAQEGLIVSSRFVGGIVVGLILWTRREVVPIRPTLLIANAVVAISGVLLLIPGLESLLAVSALRGLVAGFVIPLAGMFSSLQRRWRPGFVAALTNAALSFGLFALAAVGTVLGFLRGMEVPWRVYWVAGPIVAIASILVGSFARIATPSAQRRKNTQGALRLLVSETSWRFTTIGFFMVGIEASLFGLLPAVSARAAITGPQLAEVYALAVLGGVLVGRLSSTAWLPLFHPAMIVKSSVLVLATFGTIWWSGVLSPLISLFFVGLGTSVLFPSTLALIIARLGVHAPRTIAATGWSGGVGGTLVPLAISRTFLASSSPINLWFVLLGALLLLFLLLPRSSTT